MDDSARRNPYDHHNPKQNIRGRYQIGITAGAIARGVIPVDGDVSLILTEDARF
jgi:hypothetical protein